MSTLERAIQIAASAHAGQKDKGGEPYILHPLTVMQNVPAGDARIVAVLHDVVEDTEVTLDLLHYAGFSKQVLDAVEALTREDDELYDDYIDRVKTNPLAVKVKRADLYHNMDLSRLGGRATRTEVRRINKYQSALARLGG